MKNRKKIILLSLILCVIVISFLVATNSYADAGRFSGNHSFSSGGSFYSRSFGSSRNYGYSNYESRGGSGIFSTLFYASLFGVRPIYIILVIFIFYISRSFARGVNTNKDVVLDIREDLSVLEPLKEKDKNFSVSKFKEKVSHLYIDLQHAWTDFDLDRVKNSLSPTLFGEFENMLKELKNQNCKNFVENIAVLRIDIVGYKEEVDTEVIDLIITTRIVDYVQNLDTGEVVSGSKKAENFMTYKWEMARSKNKLTKVQEEALRKGVCPSCGAPIDINISTRCEYCGTIVESKDYDWVLRNIEGLAQEICD